MPAPGRGSRPARAARWRGRAPAVLLIRRCRRIASMIWSPMVWTGDSDDIGSWKIIAMSRPRIARIAAAARRRACEIDGRRRPARRSKISPPTMRPGASTICRIERAVTLLPQPLSPTMQSVWPRGASKRDAVDRLHDAVAHREIGREIAHLENRIVDVGGVAGSRHPIGHLYRDRRRRAGRRPGS